MTTVSVRNPAANHLWWLIGLGGFAVFMLLFFLFGYSSFYGLWCKVTGTQISPNNPTTVAATGTTGREIEVFFEAKAYDNLPVRFYPSEPLVVAKVGVDTKVTYRFKNLSDESVHFRPIHQVSPAIAGQHFSMKMCFCFTDQTIPPGASTEFPVIFAFDEQIDPRISSVTVRYSLFRIREGDVQSTQQKRIQDQLEAAGGLPGGAVTKTPGFEDISLPAVPERPAVPVPQAVPPAAPKTVPTP